VPLYRAHQRLDAQFRELGQKSQGLSDSASKAQLDLKAMTAQRDQLQAEHDQRDSAQKGDADKLERLRAALATKLDKLAKKGGAAVVINGGAVVVALDSAFLFVPQKLDVAPPARATLCDLVKSSDAKSIAVHGSLAEEASVPPALAKSYPGPIQLSAARAAAIASLLQSACSVPAAQLSAIGNGARDPSGAQLASFKPADRVELELSLH
jgi:flagellar motor protein MotB